MIEKGIEKYFNEQIAKYYNDIYKVLESIFGSENGHFIDVAMSTTVVYQAAKTDIDFYNDNYDSLISEERELVDYFKEKLQDDEHYNIGSTSGIITQLMEEKKNIAYYSGNDGKFISISVLNNPLQLYFRDEWYFYILSWMISSDYLHKYSKDIVLKDIFLGREIREYICKFIGVEIAKRLHLKGIYIFESEKLSKEYEQLHDEYEQNVVSNKDFANDKYLLKPLMSVLPLMFSNLELFLSKVGRENFEMLIIAIKSNDGEKVYESINHMKESLIKNDSSEIVMVDTSTILNAVKSMNEKRESEASKEDKQSMPENQIPRLRKPSIPLLGDLNIKEIINNINNSLIDTDKYGTKLLYIDEDGKDTLDPPSGRKM